MGNEIDVKTTSDLISSISVHGVSNIIQTKRIFIRLIWSVMLVLSAGFCFYSIYTTIFTFLNYQVVTNTRIEDQDSFLFPGITICNRNQNLTIDQMLINCTIVEKPCNTSQFIITKVYKPIICYSFNMFTESQIKFYTPRHFLEMDIYTGVTKDLQMDESGVSVLISKNNYYKQKHTSIDVASGMLICIN